MDGLLATEIGHKEACDCENCRGATRDKSTVLADVALGTSQKLTPEGFLLCVDVPIARIGMQQYLNSELPNVEGGRDGVIHVERKPEDVFSPATIASFAGKPVTDEHPEDMLSPDNVRKYMVGITLDPRQGQGFLQDYLVADLLIMDAHAIQAVRDGKREISCGYDAQYEVIGPGRARQHTIVGNHVALVKRGRCGPSCAIGDEDMPNKKTVWDRLRAAFDSQDKLAFRDAMSEAEESNDGEPSGPGIHVHVNGGPNGSTAIAPSADKKVKDEGKEEEGRMERLEKDMKVVKDAVDGLTKRFNDAFPNKEDEDEDTEDAESGKEDEEKKEAKDKKMKDRKGTKDSADLTDAFTAVLSDAEVLAPGLSLPTFDAKADRKLTLDSMCLLRRRALAAARNTEAGKHALDMLGGIKPNMTCDAAEVLFNGAVALVKDSMGRADPSKFGSKPAGSMSSIADFNRRKNEFWDGKSAKA